MTSMILFITNLIIKFYNAFAITNAIKIWITNAIKNAQSNCMKGSRKQNRIDILDWTLEIKEVSLILNLDTEEISYMVTKLPCDLCKKRVSTDTVHKSNNSLGTTNTL